jgi:hypothetical protein
VLGSGFEAEGAMATVKEAFTAKYQGNKNVQVTEVSFTPGEEVKILKEWKDETCLIKKGDRVFNVPKKYLSLG